jgi:hypothetical protein
VNPKSNFAGGQFRDNTEAVILMASDLLPFALKFWRLCLGLLLIGLPLSACAQDRHRASQDEYKVYEAVFGLMNRIPKEDPYVGIFSLTLNTKCGAEAGPVPLYNGCTFFWAKPDTADTVKTKLRGWSVDVSDSTWSDFEAKNTESASLREPITTPWRHKLINPSDEPPKGSDSPDLGVFVSRVGFNENKTEAIVYLLTFSYIGNVPSTGDYFLFRADKDGHWQATQRLTYITIDSN